MHACQHNAHKRACTFLYLSIAFNRAEFGDDDENESFSGGSNVYSQRFLHFWSNMRMRTSAMLIYVHALFYIWP